MCINVACRADVAVPQPLLNLLQAHAIGIEQTGAAMPLRYNNDKQKKPLFSRGLSVCRLLFNSFSKLKIDENYKEKMEAVLLTTKFNSASGPALCLTAGCRGRFTFIGGRPFFILIFERKEIHMELNEMEKKAALSSGGRLSDKDPE